MIDLLFHTKLTCDFSHKREISISQVAINATTNPVVFYSLFL